MDRLSLSVAEGEFLALLGSSGCGKTTTLRLIRGLDFADSGTIGIGGVLMTGTPPHKRMLGLVPQNYALFPHLSVADSVAFGLRMRRWGRQEIRRAVEDALSLVQLQDFARRFPSQLSGGQQQRVALARALAVRPTVLLLDEPMAALDRRLRTQMQIELRAMQRKLGVTTIMVTHDQEEAMAMADRIAVMDKGGIVQLDSPRDLYDRPRTLFVANFVGLSNVFRSEDGGKDSIVRPEHIRLIHVNPNHQRGIRGTVTDIVFLGPAVHYHVKLADGRTILAVDGGGSSEMKPGFEVGNPVSVFWDLIFQHALHA